MINTIKQDLKRINKNQVWLVFKLRDVGMRITPSELSNCINGVLVTPKSHRVIREAEKIIKQEEQAS